MPLLFPWHPCILEGGDIRPERRCAGLGGKEIDPKEQLLLILPFWSHLESPSRAVAGHCF